MRTRRTFASLLLAVAALAGCQLESVEKIDLTLEGKPKHFIAGFETATRTTVDSTGKTSWKAGDPIRYYSAAGGTVGTAIVERDCTNADFVANVGNEDSFFIAEYGGIGITNNANGKSFTITCAIPDEQSGRFEDAHVAVSKTYVELGEKPQSITFKNITSLIEFTLERTDVAKVVFKAEGGENLRGNGDINISFKDVVATPSFAGDKDSTIVVNTGGAGTFYISTLPTMLEKGFSIECLNSNGASLGAAVGKKALTLNTNTILSLGIIDSRIEKPYEDLSADGTANCYIASKPGGDYKFNATVKGNSYEALDGTPFKVSVLWESFGTDVTPKVGDVVSNVSFAEGYIRFTAGQNGNAVIAIKDRDDEVLWSWHIWVCENFDPVATQQEYNNNAGIMMDRNLGATSAIPGDVHALGLLYQWGRKDPFLGGCQISYSSFWNQQKAASTLSWPSPVSSDASNGTIVYAVGHPTTFIKYNSNNYDWYYTGTSTTDNTRWQTSDKAKGMYDPCPAGWRVPDGGEDGVWSTAFGTSSWWETSSNWDGANKGMDFGSTDKKLGIGTIWYPAAGNLDDNDGSLHNVGDYGCFWSCTPLDYLACYLYFNYYYGDVDPSSNNYRASGRSVRCLSESSPTIVPVTYVSISETSASLKVGATKTLSASVVPTNANVKTITWSSDNESVATVDQTGKVTAISEGTATITAKTYNGILQSCTVTVKNPGVEDLSAAGTANCYIASIPGGKYKFYAMVKGNSTESIDGAPYKASVLWESFGTDKTPSIGDVVSNVSFANDSIYFTSGQNGNAVIAIKDRDDEILWSWHIWVCEGFDPKATQQEYNNNACIMMDRNLGVTSATPGDVHALGLLYQWGRKDPFLSGCQISYSSSWDQQRAASTLSWPSPVSSDASNGTIAYAVGHPTTFITYNSNNYDWYYTGSSSTDNTRWQTSDKAKGMYDPCPAGWRVPDGGKSGVWSTAFGASSSWITSSNWDGTNKGMDFGSTDKKLGTGTIWYPAAGSLGSSDGSLLNVGSGGRYWSCTPNDHYAYYLYFYNSGSVSPSSSYFRACGQSVRCLSE